jgi:hypothetical protein
MSLIQHVHTHDGTDREEALVDLFLPPVERQVTHERERERRASLESGFGGDGSRSLRQVISYDALKPPTQPTHGEEYGGVTQYHVSTAKRLGKLTRFGIQPQVYTEILTCVCSSGHHYGTCMLVCEWNCLRLCST